MEGVIKIEGSECISFTNSILGKNQINAESFH